MIRSLIAVVCLFLTVSLCGTSVKGHGVKWFSDVESAQKSLKGEKKAILLFFTAPGWCGPCRMLEAGPVASPEFAKLVNSSAAAVKLDYSNRRNLSDKARAALQKYQIEGFPSMLVLDANGKEKGRLVGNLPKKLFLEKLEGLVKTPQKQKK